MAYFEFIAEIDSRGRITIPANIIREGKFVKASKDANGQAVRVRVRPVEEEF